MKLLYCPICGDVCKLGKSGHRRKCACKASWGCYHADGLHATVGGEAIPLGFENLSFTDALRRRPHDGLGATFTAFIIPRKCEHVTVEAADAEV